VRLRQTPSHQSLHQRKLSLAPGLRVSMSPSRPEQARTTVRERACVRGRWVQSEGPQDLSRRQYSYWRRPGARRGQWAATPTLKSGRTGTDDPILQNSHLCPLVSLRKYSNSRTKDVNKSSFFCHLRKKRLRILGVSVPMITDCLKWNDLESCSANGQDRTIRYEVG
jgi:hypothetical protein